MGYQLWTSPVTGYRRRGTRLSELRALLASGITAHAILEPLQSCPQDAPAIEMRHALQVRGFDVAGVWDEHSRSVVGYVVRESLRDGVVGDHLQPLTAKHLVSETTSLATLLSVFKDRQHVFVLAETEIAGIVTRADLNKPPVRVYLFGLISLLEMHLGFWARATYGETSWEQMLTPRRLEAAKSIQADLRARNQEMVLVECLQFCDRRDLVLAKDELRTKLRIGTKACGERFLKSAEDLRNTLAHSQQDLAQGSSWEEVIDLVKWVENVVHTSDECVENKARSSAMAGEERLWGSA